MMLPEASPSKARFLELVLRKARVRRIALFMEAELFGRIDDWRRMQPDLMSRSEAIRRLIEIGFDASGKGDKKPKG